MPAPIAGFIQTPTDSGNTGKKVRTQTRVVGADTVYEHFFVPIRQQTITGIHSFTLPIQSVQASAQNGTTTGFLWIQLPAGSSVKAALRRCQVSSVATGTVAMLTAPRIVLARFTFTGTASGATITPAKRDPLDAANVTQFRTASTGMTVTLGAVLHSYIPSTILTGVGADSPSEQERAHTDQDAFDVIPPGEGIVLYQPDAGTASDSRRFTVNGTLEERDNT